MKSFKNIIQSGGVAVIKTDTLYGLVADAYNQSAVDRIYTIKKRNPLKAAVVLVSDIDAIRNFGISISPLMETLLLQYWPGKVSIILPVTSTVKTHYIHKGTGGIAFRIPADKSLRKLLQEVGSLVAPSANPEGLAPAKNINQAEDYFGDKVDYYVDGGEVTDTKPSKIIKVSKNFDIEIIRDE